MKRKIINSFIILSFSSLITKIFSIISRMLLARLLPNEAMTLYLLVMPTLSLCITIGQLSLPSAVFRLISFPEKSNKKVMFNALVLALMTSCIMCMLILFLAKPIALTMLKNNRAYYPILSMVLFIPLVSISGILKSYFLGKEETMIIAKTQLFEEISRICFLYLLLQKPLSTHSIFLVTIAYLAMSFGELISIIYMSLKLIFKYKEKFQWSHYKDLQIIKDIADISLPLTGARIYHCLVSFLEPIILISILTYLGINKGIVERQYAIISGYVISIVFTPTFFNSIIYRIYLPIATRDIYNKSDQTLSHLITALFASLFIAIPFTLLFFFFPKNCIMLIYNTNEGWQHLKNISIPFMIVYLQTPISVLLHVFNKNKIIFWTSFFECTLEIILTISLTFIYHVKSILVSTYFGLLSTLIISAYFVFKEMKQR